MQSITPMLWFDNQAEEAANFYVSVFKKNSKIKQVTHYAGEDIPEKKGQVMTVSFELNGQEFTALNGGPEFKFTEAVSFTINCDTQEEINYLYQQCEDESDWFFLSFMLGTGLREGEAMHAETSDLVAGWYMIDVDSYERAVELAAYVSSEPGPGGEPLYEWIDVREVMSGAPSQD